MSTTVPADARCARLQRLFSLSILSIPLAATGLLMTQALRLGLPTVFAVCGVVVAVVGGCTKLGSP